VVVAANSLRIAVLGPDEETSGERRSFGLWPSGYAAAIDAAGALPVRLDAGLSGRSWTSALAGAHGLVWTGVASPEGPGNREADRLCAWCRKKQLPLLAVDAGLHVLNAVHGGTVYHDLAEEVPEALQHRHPPEKGLRHAINISEGTRLADLYGEGELVVNSEHRQAISRVGRGFRVTARALDGVIEAIEADSQDWFAVGVQWRPASATASGLDIQLFRGLIHAGERRLRKSSRRARLACTSAA
jgi:putative glutamine amidotransferase